MQMFLKIIFLSRGLMLALADCEVLDVGSWAAFSLSFLVDTDITKYFATFHDISESPWNTPVKIMDNKTAWRGFVTDVPLCTSV